MTCRFSGKKWILLCVSINFILFLKYIYAIKEVDLSSAANPSHDHIKQEKVERIEMMRHSFESPLTLDTTLAEWDLAMATVPVKKSVVLVPGVAARTGQFWHKSPIKTPHFEITFTFEVIKSEDKSSQAEGFALWFVEEAYGTIYPKTNDDLLNWNLLGYKNNPKGIGVLFAFLDRNNKRNPSISLLLSDGTKSFSFVSDIPTSMGVYYNFCNSKEPISFRLYVSPVDGIIGQVRSSPTSRWIDCFKAGSKSIPQNLSQGGYIGFSAYSGIERNDSDAQSKSADRISIFGVHVYNYDLSKAGEELDDTFKSSGASSSSGSHSVEITDLLRDVHVKGDKDVAEALKAFSQILYKHITEATPREQAIHRTLNTVLTQTQKLIIDIKEIQRQINYHFGSNHSEALSTVKSELVGLKTLFDRHSKYQTSTLIELEDSLKSKTDATAEVHKAIQSHYSTSSIISFLLIFIIISFGLIVWKKVKDIEKKHLL
ncbi:legume-like lectin family protein [Cryptosporidium serpentis]